MSILNSKNSSVVTTLSLVAVAVSGLSFTANVLADSHIVRVDANTGITYNSALSDYRTLDGSEKSGWKQSNDTVGKIGGWRTYANEAYEANKRLDEEQMNEAEMSDTPVEQNSEPVDSAAMTSDKPATEPMMTNEDDTTMMSDNEPMIANSRIPEPVVGLPYQSATAKHRAYEEVNLKDWKSANDRVGEIGGWRVYANEAYQANKKMASDAGANQ